MAGNLGSEMGGSTEDRSTWRILLWLMALLCCLSASHCALRPVPKDLAAYINRDIYGVAELEDLALESYAGQTGGNYASDQALREALGKVIIPAYERLTVLAGGIKPRTEAVKKLHSLYLGAAYLRLNGFRKVLLAIDTHDPALIRQANGMLERGRGLIARWQAGVAQMAGQYGMELN